MTFLHSAARLKNQYYVLRHGESKANVQNIILSDLYDGQLKQFTLTQEGELQAQATATEILASGELDSDTIIISSPFSRCQKTAKIVKKVLKTHTQILFDERLRERWFGDWERQSNVYYQNVWHDDELDPNHNNANVESATHVQERTASLIEYLERRHTREKILLVSHGDALQILQTAFSRKSPSTHRNLKHLKTAEIRRFELATE